MTIKKLLFTVTAFIISSIIYAQQPQLETVTTLDVRPGNVAVGNHGRVFSTIHPLAGPKTQLVEITGKTTYVPFPDVESQNSTGIPDNKKFDTPLGLRVDKDNVLWIIDMGLGLGKTRLFAYDIDTKKQVFYHEFPEDIAPKGSFIQDLAVDKVNGFVYLADIANPGIVIVNLKNKSIRRFSDASMQSENINMVINGNVINFGGKPARVAVNPITLSADRETLYYGAMNGTTWYSVPTKHFRENDSDDVISKTIRVVGPKPISDGVATDAKGNHYFTNIQHGGIDVLTAEGELKPLLRDSKIDWADNVSIGPDGKLYIAVNQLYKTPAFTGGKDQGKPPYYILKTKIKK